MSSVPPNFKWVEARAACSPAQVFKQMELDATSDTAAMKEVGVSGTRRVFRVTPNSGGNMFFVHQERDDPYGEIRTVKFSVQGDEIAIVLLDKTTLIATLTLNNDGQCRLKINGLEYEQWQVRKMALEPLLFG
jgi:hypothetical protein